MNRLSNVRSPVATTHDQPMIVDRLDFDDHPFDVQRRQYACALSGSDGDPH